MTQTVLAKTSLILRSFRPDDRGVNLAELQRRTGLSKTTLHRLCTELVSERLLERTGTSYRLGRLMFELGMRASVERRLLDVATPFLEDLYQATHETVHLGVREGTDVVYIAKIGGHQQVASPSRVGGRLPLFCTAIGKAMLAYAPDQGEVLQAGLPRRTARTITAPGLLQQQLQKISTAGVAFEHEESTTGIVCVAAPIKTSDGVVAAVSVAGPITRFRPEKFAGVVQAAAAGISQKY